MTTVNDPLDISDPIGGAPGSFAYVTGRNANLLSVLDISTDEIRWILPISAQFTQADITWFSSGCVARFSE